MKKYLAGVSGGPDSMAMLDLFKNDIEAVCFVNYFDRNDTYIDDEIVTNYCNKNNIKLFKLEVTKKKYDSYKINNFQNVCRQIRYQFYNEIASQLNLDTVLIGHNYDDFLETAYSQIIHNKKNLFLGIKSISNFQDIIIYRPLLNYRKDDLKKYCDSHNINYIIDSTNSKDIYQRNIHRKILKNLSSDEMNNFINYVNKYNKKNQEFINLLNNCFHYWQKREYDLGFFNHLEPKTQYHLIYLFLSTFFVSQINANKINQIVYFLNKKNNHSKSYRISNQFYLSKTNKKLSITRM